jgi:hypothetical protein
MRGKCALFFLFHKETVSRVYLVNIIIKYLIIIIYEGCIMYDTYHHLLFREFSFILSNHAALLAKLSFRLAGPLVISRRLGRVVVDLYLELYARRISVAARICQGHALRRCLGHPTAALARKALARRARGSIGGVVALFRAAPFVDRVQKER